MTTEEQIRQRSKTKHFEKYNVEGSCPDFEYGARWMKKLMIDKTCEWLKVNLITVVTDDYTYTASVHNISREEFIEQFKKTMEE